MPVKFKNTNNLISEIEITYKSKVKVSEAPIVQQSVDAFNLLLPYFKQIELYEECFVLLLNRANRVIGVNHISQGGTSGTVVDPRLIFAVMLKTNTYGAILAHNHPSGNLAPSKADEEMTGKISQGCRLFDLKLFDHLIISNEGFYSFADNGLF